MNKRIIFGLIMIAALSAIFWIDWSSQGSKYDGLAIALLCTALSVVGFIEIKRLATKKHLHALPTSGIIASITIGTFPFWWPLIAKSPLALQWASPMIEVQMLLLLMGMVVLLVFAEQMIRHRVENALANLACTFLAITYISIGTALILSLRLTHSLEILLLFIIAVKFTDMGAYFTGKAIGRHKMIPWLSPGKSWEGLVGGLIIAAGVTALASELMGIENLALWEALIFGAVVGLAGQFADLCESLLKRSAGVKDSGNLVPNFGGVLDMVDSPLLAIPVATALVTLFI